MMKRKVSVMRAKWVGSSLLVCGLAIAVSACGSSSSSSSGSAGSGASSAATSSKAPLTILMINDTTGPAKAFGLSHLWAAESAAAYINAHGGADGHKLLIQQMSDNGDNTTAVSEFIKAETSGKHYVSCDCGQEDDLPALVPVLAKYPQFSVSESDTASQCTTGAQSKCPNQWFLYPRPEISQLSLAKWMQSKGYKKVGILLESMAFTDTEAANFTKAVAGTGITTTTATYPPTAVNLTPQMQQLKSAGADVVYALALGPPAGYALKARAALGWSVPVVVDVAGASTDLTKLVPAADIKNAYEEVLWNEDPKSTIPGLAPMYQYAKPFGDLTQGGVSPNDNQGISWDEVMTVKDAIVAAGGDTSTKALDAAMLKLPSTDPLTILTHKRGFEASNHSNTLGAANDFVIVPAGPLSNGQVQAP